MLFEFSTFFSLPIPVSFFSSIISTLCLKCAISQKASNKFKMPKPVTAPRNQFEATISRKKAQPVFSTVKAKKKLLSQLPIKPMLIHGTRVNEMPAKRNKIIKKITVNFATINSCFSQFSQVRMISR